MVKHLSFIDVWNEKKIESYPSKKLTEIKEGLHKKGFRLITE